MSNNFPSFTLQKHKENNNFRSNEILFSENQDIQSWICF